MITVCLSDNEYIRDCPHMDLRRVRVGEWMRFYQCPTNVSNAEIMFMESEVSRIVDAFEAKIKENRELGKPPPHLRHYRYNFMKI